MYCTGPTGAAKAERKSLVPAQQVKEVPLSFVLFESPFTSVSTVSRDHPSLVSLVKTDKTKLKITATEA